MNTGIKRLLPEFNLDRSSFQFSLTEFDLQVVNYKCLNDVITNFFLSNTCPER